VNRRCARGWPERKGLKLDVCSGVVPEGVTTDVDGGGRRRGGAGKAGAGGRTRLVRSLRTESRPFGVVCQSIQVILPFDREREGHSRSNSLTK
jgi:hypothetical protein